jgi:hypothetical protein
MTTDNLESMKDGSFQMTATIFADETPELYALMVGLQPGVRRSRLLRSLAERRLDKAPVAQAPAAGETTQMKVTIPADESPELYALIIGLQPGIRRSRLLRSLAETHLDKAPVVQAPAISQTVHDGAKNRSTASPLFQPAANLPRDPDYVADLRRMAAFMSDTLL